MALEEKRALDEILIRVNSKTATGSADGVALRFRTWVEKDGVEMEGTSRLESPKPSDWQDPEVVSRLDELCASLGSQVSDLQAQLDAKTQELEALAAQLADLQGT